MKLKCVFNSIIRSEVHWLKMLTTHWIPNIHYPEDSCIMISSRQHTITNTMYFYGYQFIVICPNNYNTYDTLLESYILAPLRYCILAWTHDLMSIIYVMIKITFFYFYSYPKSENIMWKSIKSEVTYFYQTMFTFWQHLILSHHIDTEWRNRIVISFHIFFMLQSLFAFTLVCQIKERLKHGSTI